MFEQIVYKGLTVHVEKNMLHYRMLSMLRMSSPHVDGAIVTSHCQYFTIGIKPKTLPCQTQLLHISFHNSKYSKLKL